LGVVSVVYSVATQESGKLRSNFTVHEKFPQWLNVVSYEVVVIVSGSADERRLALAGMRSVPVVLMCSCYQVSVTLF
jgi:hypothetical protein